jgi:phytoene dehydrogenase-like protein
VVVGSGPNGLVGAVELARRGWQVTVLEGAARPGGGTRSEELLVPGVVHDVCSAVHPLAVASPALRMLGLRRHGLEWVHPGTPLAHVMGDGRAVLLERSLEATSAGLGADGPRWTRLMEPLVEAGTDLVDTVLSPWTVPWRNPLPAARFARQGLRSAASLASRFATPEAAALLAGLAAHSTLPLDEPGTAGYGVLLGVLAHLVGWPLAAGGSQRIADALVAELLDHAGELRCGETVHDLDDLGTGRSAPAAVLADLAPRQLLKVAGDRLGPHPRYRAALRRFRQGPGAFKVDWVLRGPIPWSDPAVARAGTVHLGGTFEQVAGAEAEVHRGGHPEQPFVLLVQPSRFDPSRVAAATTAGLHTAWAYCHVPNGSRVDMSGRIEATVEAAAPGFGELVVARHTMDTAELQHHNPNYVGGDITGGAGDLRQLLTRPVARPQPWRTAMPGVYLCSASTPPGGGVHGMCGWHAARLAERDLR